MLKDMTLTQMRNILFEAAQTWGPIHSIVITNDLRKGS